MRGKENEEIFKKEASAAGHFQWVCPLPADGDIAVVLTERGNIVGAGVISGLGHDPDRHRVPSVPGSKGVLEI